MKKNRFFPCVLLSCLLMGLAAPCAMALETPSLNAQAAVLVDLDAGRVLYGYNMDAERAPASLTKVMTVLLTLEAIDSGRVSLDDMIVAQDSANEACNIVGRYIAGSISGFVDMMNKKAGELGCRHTHYMNTHGMPAEGHYSSAYDQYLIFAEAMTHPLFMEVSNAASYQPESSAINNGEPIGNSNALINITSIYSNGGRYLYEGASGGKTGYTRAAGYCLVSTAQRSGVHLLAVVMGCDGALNAQIEDYFNFIDSRTLYDWGFNNFSYRTLLSTNEVVERQEVELAEGDVLAMLRPAEELRALMPNEVSDEDIRREVILYNDTLRGAYRRRHRSGRGARQRRRRPLRHQQAGQQLRHRAVAQCLSRAPGRGDSQQGLGHRAFEHSGLLHDPLHHPHHPLPPPAQKAPAGAPPCRKAQTGGGAAAPEAGRALQERRPRGPL